ncbi:MAG: AraC family transcriptional regulator [Hyphomicrobiaceae bacterium]
MDLHLEEFSPREVVYTRRVGPYQEMAPIAWRSLWSWLREKGHAGDVKRAIGFGLDDPTTTPLGERRYDACVELHVPASEDPEFDIAVQNIPGGPYAIHRLRGPYHQIGDAFQELHRAALPEKGLMADYTRPFLEIYINDPADVPERELLTDLCIPVDT